MSSGLDFRTTSDMPKAEKVDDIGEPPADVKPEPATADGKDVKVSLRVHLPVECVAADSP